MHKQLKIGKFEENFGAKKQFEQQISQEIGK